MKLFKKIAFFSIAVLVVSCGKKEVSIIDPLLTNRDTTVSPAVDFFHYANGGWFNNHPIPSSEKSNGIFRMIKDKPNNLTLIRWQRKCTF